MKGSEFGRAKFKQRKAAAIKKGSTFGERSAAEYFQLLGRRNFNNPIIELTLLLERVKSVGFDCIFY